MKFTLAELVELASATLQGDPNFVITGVADLESASPAQISFLAPNPFGNTNYTKAMQNSQAGAIFISPEIALPEGRNILITDDPSQAFQQVVSLFYPKIPSDFTGIHPTAMIHPSTKIEENVTIGPYVVIDREAKIGPGTTIEAHTFIGAESTIGKGCHLHPRVTIREGCHLGNRVIIQPGAVIGGDGFGFTTSKEGVHTKIDQLGGVEIGDDVEIGANTAVDRARFGNTCIKRGSKIDNLVQIAHGVEIGEHNLIAGQTGIAGSTKTGTSVVIAGQVAINGHIQICSGAIIAARSGVMQSIKEPGKYMGEPARPYAEYRRFFMHLMRIERYGKRLAELEKKLMT